MFDKKEYLKNYNIVNRERIKAYKDKYCKNYYIENREVIFEKMKQKIECECGCILNKSNLLRHKKNKKHQKYISNLNN